MNSGIEIASVTKRYGDFYALDDVSLSIREGEFLTLLGPSGSGKTTLLMSIAGFSSLDTGRISAGDRDISSLPPHKRNLGFVFQNYALFPHMTVAENVAYPLRIRGVSKSERLERAQQALQTVKMGSFGHREVSELSGGQAQRVAVARAIVFEPGIILMDEPLSALDKNLREEMQFELKDLHNRLGYTIVYVTHDQKEALTMSDRIAVLNQGRIQQLGTPTEIYRNPESRFVADFIGQASFLSLDMADSDSGIDIRIPESLREKARPVDNPLLVIRPEQILLDQQHKSTPDKERLMLTGSLASMVFQGDVLLADIEVSSDLRLRVQLGSRSELIANLPAIGGVVEMSIDVNDVAVVSGIDIKKVG